MQIVRFHFVTWNISPFAYFHHQNSSIHSTFTPPLLFLFQLVANSQEAAFPLPSPWLTLPFTNFLPIVPIVARQAVACGRFMKTWWRWCCIHTYKVSSRKQTAVIILILKHWKRIGQMDSITKDGYNDINLPKLFMTKWRQWAKEEKNVRWLVRSNNSLFSPNWPQIGKKPSILPPPR